VLSRFVKHVVIVVLIIWTVYSTLRVFFVILIVLLVCVKICYIIIDDDFIGMAASRLD